VPGVIDRLRSVAIEAVSTGPVHHSVVDQLSNTDLTELFEQAIARG
jgi:hypothetical protein